MGYKYILLDADNTLFDFDLALLRAVEKLYKKYGIEFNDETFGLYRDHNESCWRMLEKKEITKEELQAKRFRLLTESLDLTHLDPGELNSDFITFLGQGNYLIPGALELCESLSRRHVLTIATNGIYRSQIARFKSSEIIEYIGFIAISDQLGHSKPAPEFFEQTLELCGCADKSQAIMIGDSLTADIAGGHGFGITTCWYNPGRKELTGPIKPDYTVYDLKEILNIV